MSKSDNFDVRAPEIETLLQDLGRSLKRRMPLGWGFTLFLSNYGPGGAMFYISSVNREDMLKALVEFIERQVQEPETHEPETGS